MLSADLAAKFLEIVPRSMRSIRTEMRKAASPELSVTQFRIMAHLIRNPANNSELAESIGVSIPAMSRSIQTMVTGGYVKRTYKPSDRRKVQLELTAKGETTFARLRKAAHSHFIEGFSGLDAVKKDKLAEGFLILEEVFGQGKLPGAGSS